MKKHQRKGNDCGKTTLSDLALKTIRNRSPTVWVGTQCSVPLSTPMFQSMSEIKSRKMNLENKCAMIETPHLPYSAPNAQIDSIAVIHMERRVG